MITFFLNLGNISEGRRSNYCITSKTSNCSTGFNGSSVMCKITDICQLESLLENARQNFTKLDLSSNQLQMIPRCSLARYRSLELLSLAYNDIRYLAFKAFYGLSKLKTLNLTGNPFRSFTGQVLGLFHSLETIDANGIKEWKPEKSLLQLRKLKNISGFFWSGERECQFCSLYRLNSTWSPKAPIINGYWCEVYHYKVNLLSPMATYLNNTPFDLRCHDQHEILEFEFKDHYCKHGWSTRNGYEHKLYQRVDTTNACWEKQLKFMLCLAIFGVFTALLNLVVFVNIFSSRVLRKNVMMLLVSNLALGDFFVSVYAIIIGNISEGRRSNYCITSKTSNCSTGFNGSSVMCKITDICQLESLLENARQNFTKLDLSSNQLQMIPRCSLARYRSLELLSLAYNDIRYLAFKAFYGLSKLKTLLCTIYFVICESNISVGLNWEKAREKEQVNWQLGTM
ncbi:Toll-like receptor 3 [Exaiptasia diaphana]|nr:Toll-like receptor 3 [Exaiptasia diaphana]